MQASRESSQATAAGAGVSMNGSTMATLRSRMAELNNSDQQRASASDRLRRQEQDEYNRELELKREAAFKEQRQLALLTGGFAAPSIRQYMEDGNIESLQRQQTAPPQMDAKDLISRFTPESIDSYRTTGKFADLQPIKSGTQLDPNRLIGKYTMPSISAYMQSDDTSTLQPVEPDDRPAYPSLHDTLCVQLE